MTYTPNFGDPRTQRRIAAAVTAIQRHIKPGRVYAIAQSQRRTWFGNLSNPLSSWLDQNLLEVADPYFNMSTGQCIKYRLRDQDLVNLMTQTGITNTYEPSSDVQQQIQTGDFDYDLKSDRWYTAAQFIPSHIRGPLLANAGYRYAYDIEAAAPTLLLQQAQHVRPDFCAPGLTAYIQDRNTVRDQIAQQTTTSSDIVKQVINAVLQGSILSTHSSSKLFDALNQDYGLVQRLRTSHTLTAIRKDISVVWQCLRDQFPRDYITTSSGSKRLCRLTARQKSSYYRLLEKQVATTIKKYLKQQGVRHLWVHDGWQCDKAIDPVELCARVRQQTGFVIQLDCAVFEDL